MHTTYFSPTKMHNTDLSPTKIYNTYLSPTKIYKYNICNTYLSPTKMPGKTSSEIFLTLAGMATLNKLRSLILLRVCFQSHLYSNIRCILTVFMLTVQSQLSDQCYQLSPPFSTKERADLHRQGGQRNMF